MGTSNAKALRRYLRGGANKFPEERSSDLPPRAHAKETELRGISRKKYRTGLANESVSPSGRSSRGLSASAPSRVSGAKRGTPGRRKGPEAGSSSRGARRKRGTGRDANPKGIYSVPDTGAVFDRQTIARSSGRRNKATARNAALRKGA